MMMMVSDDCLVDCRIDDDDDDDDDDEEQLIEIEAPPPPPEFASIPATPPAPSPPPTPPISYHYDNRDPYGINRHLQVECSDVLAEPASPHSMDRVWVYSVVGLESARVWVYRCLSLLCAVPLALLSGCLLALLACLHIWCVMPCVQVCHSCLPCARSLWMCTVNVFISPFCSSVARCCSQITVSLTKEHL